MKLFSIEGKGLFISLGITLIICGALAYYCYIRLNIVDDELRKQRTILNSFIHDQIKNINKDIASSEAIAASEAIVDVKTQDLSLIHISEPTRPY